MLYDEPLSPLGDCGLRPQYAPDIPIRVGDSRGISRKTIDPVYVDRPYTSIRPLARRSPGSRLGRPLGFVLFAGLRSLSSAKRARLAAMVAADRDWNSSVDVEAAMLMSLRVVKIYLKRSS